MKTENSISPNVNQEFLTAITASFNSFLDKGTSRSTAKLIPLHGFIAKKINELLGCNYIISSKGYGNGEEDSIKGRYFDKKVDITIKKENAIVAGIAVKFVMQNYSPNSINYFENMLGETANIRCAKYPYFQIFIIFDKLPHYNNNRDIKHWETFSDHSIAKYQKLSKDNADIYYHTPNKTLLYVIHIPDNEELKTKDEYLNYYKSLHPNIVLSTKQYNGFGDAIIINDFSAFINKVYHTIMAL